MLVLAVGAGAMAGSLAAAQRTAEESRGRLVALQTARSVLEQVKRTAVDDLPTLDTDALLPDTLNDVSIDLGTNPAIPVGQDLVTVTVTVSWTGPGGRPMSVELTTMRSRYS